MLASPSLPETLGDRDERLIRQWRTATGMAKDKALTELLASLAAPIGLAVNQYRAAPLPFATLELEAKRLAVEALNDWKPGMGTKPGSFVRTRVGQRLFRYVSEHQNVGRLPEEMVRSIGGYKGALSDLSSRFGREPTTHEIADHMGVPVSRVTRLRKSLRAELLESTDGMDEIEDFRHEAGYEQAMLAYYSLSTQQKSVFDYLLGAHGQPRLKPGEIAVKLKMSPARVSAIKQEIATKITPHLDG